MTSKNRLTGIARIIFTVMMLLTANGMTGCSDEQAGPDPLPWTAPADPK
jgi:hypothetical protein